MKIIGFRDIQKLNLSPKLCYQWVEDAIQRKRDFLLPPKVHMNLPGNVFCNVMPGVVDGIAGVKIVSRYPERNPALDAVLLLMDAETGEYLALMDATWITAIRTGCVAAHAIKHLAKKDFNTIGLIGLGNTVRATVLSLVTEYPDRELTIKLLKYKDQAELLIQRFENYSNLQFVIETDVRKVVGGSDVVVSGATYFPDDICADDCFDEGILVIPIHTRGFTNCDLFFDRVYADDTGHVDHFKNFDRFRYYAEMCDVVNNRALGRQSDNERIIAYNIGLAIHDIYYASHILSAVKEDKRTFDQLSDADLFTPQEKFWV